VPKNAYSQSYRKMSELSSPPITLAVLGVTDRPVKQVEERKREREREREELGG
jgi:hypothetical protein